MQVPQCTFPGSAVAAVEKKMNQPIAEGVQIPCYDELCIEAVQKSPCGAQTGGRRVRGAVHMQKDASLRKFRLRAALLASKMRRSMQGHRLPGYSLQALSACGSLSRLIQTSLRRSLLSGGTRFVGAVCKGHVLVVI